MINGRVHWSDTQAYFQATLAFNLAYYSFSALRTPLVTALRRKITEARQLHAATNPVGMAVNSVPGKLNYIGTYLHPFGAPPELQRVFDMRTAIVDRCSQLSDKLDAYEAASSGRVVLGLTALAAVVSAVLLVRGLSTLANTCQAG